MSGTAFGSGAPETFPLMTETALRELANLEEGFAEIRDQTFSITGRADSAAKAERVRTALKQIPGAVKVSDQITFRETVVSPYVTAAAIENGLPRGNSLV